MNEMMEARYKSNSKGAKYNGELNRSSPNDLLMKE